MRIVDKIIRILKSIDIEYKHDVESMIYTFADKFLQGKDLEKVKAELIMTELGRMPVAIDSILYESFYEETRLCKFCIEKDAETE